METAGGGGAGAPEQAHRAQVDVLAEPAPDRDQEPPRRHVVGHTGEADRAEEDGLEPPELVEAVLGHHAPGPRVALAAPVERRPLEVEAEPAAGGVEDAHALGHALLADPVAGDHGDPVSHGSLVSAATVSAGPVRRV